MIRTQRDYARWRTSLPLDVLTVSGLALLVGLGPTTNAGALRVLAGLVLVLFAPGYVLIAALFPAHPHPGDDADPFPSTSLGWGERAALSVGASVALVPVIALVMASVGAPFTAPSMRTWLVGTVLVAGAVAAARRYALPPERRLVLPLTAWLGSVYDDTVGASRRRDAVLNVALAVSVLLALASVGFAVADAQQSDPYTGVILLAENDSGDLVAADHPTSYERGETHTYVAQVKNNRQEQRSYTVVTELQRLRSTGDGSVQVVESEVVSRQSLDVAANGNASADVSVTPSLVGDDLRLVTFVYEGDAPADPSVDSAGEYVFLWVDVSPTEAGASSDAGDDPSANNDANAGGDGGSTSEGDARDSGSGDTSDASDVEEDGGDGDGADDAGDGGEGANDGQADENDDEDGADDESGEDNADDGRDDQADGEEGGSGDDGTTTQTTSETSTDDTSTTNEPSTTTSSASTTTADGTSTPTTSTATTATDDTATTTTDSTATTTAEQ